VRTLCSIMVPWKVSAPCRHFAVGLPPQHPSRVDRSSSLPHLKPRPPRYSSTSIRLWAAPRANYPAINKRHPSRRENGNKKRRRATTGSSAFFQLSCFFPLRCGVLVETQALPDRAHKPCASLLLHIELLRMQQRIRLDQNRSFRQFLHVLQPAGVVRLKSLGYLGINAKHHVMFEMP
jgi:hypothetical protein